MSEYKHIAVKSEEAGCWRVTICREKSLNSLNSATILELMRFFQQAASKDFGARLITIEGEGGKAFAAGADIQEMGDFTAEEAHYFARKGQELTFLMERTPAVICAKISGYALGGGCELAMACDLIYATENSKFGQPETTLGIIAGFGGTQRLVKRVGPAVAMDMLCANRILTAKEAAQYGLVARVVEDNEALDAEMAKLKKRVLKCSPYANGLTKNLVQRALDERLYSGLEMESDAFGLAFQGSDAKEGLQAFLNKKSANFT